MRLDPDLAKDWSDEEVVRRWGRLFPPRDKSRQPLPVSKAWVQWRLQDAQWVATARERLQSLSWFMKCLKEPLSRLANRQDKARGAFFEGRFKSVAILDEESLLATCAYIDLNPVAAGIVEVPEASPHTSITTRIEHVKEQGRTPDLKRPQNHGSVARIKRRGRPEESIWLCPIEDRRKLDSSREGMLEGFSLGNYLLLVEYTGRLFRDGKAVISAELSGILERIGSAPKAGGPGSRNSARAACWADSSPPAETRLRSRRAPGRPPPGQPRRLPGTMSKSTNLARVRRLAPVIAFRPDVAFSLQHVRGRAYGFAVQAASPNHRFEPTPPVVLYATQADELDYRKMAAMHVRCSRWRPLCHSTR